MSGNQASKFRNVFSLSVVAGALALFAILFSFLHKTYGDEVAAFAIIPITAGYWYLGLRGGLITTVLSVGTYVSILVRSGHSFSGLMAQPAILISNFVLLFAGLVFGRMATFNRQRQNAITRLAHSNELIHSLLRVTTHIETALNPDEFAKSLSLELGKIGMDHVIALFDKNKEAFKFDYSSIKRDSLDIIDTDPRHPLSGHAFTLHQLGIPPDEKSHLPSFMIEDHQAELRALFGNHDPGRLQRFLTNINIHQETIVFRLPLILEEKLLGILWVWGDRLSASDLPVMSIFAKQVGTSLERARLFEEVQDLALTDPLTSLPNRRSLFTLGKFEFIRAVRLNRPFSCLMLDLDNFKSMNDTYGHQTGDVVLQDFAQVCRNNIRTIDLIGRYGGEEIIILLPETEIETAIQIADRLRQSVSENQSSINGHNIRITVSIGVATKDENTLELDTLIARADQAMYISKHKGRNRVAVSK